MQFGVCITGVNHIVMFRTRAQTLHGDLSWCAVWCLQAPVLPPTLHDQHYIPVIKDLRYCFSHLNFSFEIICEPQLAQGLRNLVHVLANVQNMHQQQRVEVPGVSS